MSMLEGVTQCWALGKQCHIWWEAWAAMFSGLAAVVAALSAYAVFLLGRRANELGKQANSLAKSAHDVASEDRAERERQAHYRAGRQERAILASVFGELDAMAGTLSALLNVMEPGQAASLRIMASEDAVRTEFSRRIQLIETARIDSTMASLPDLPPETGMRLARLAGDCAILKVKSATFLEHPLVTFGEPGNSKSDEHLVFETFNVMKMILERAVKDHTFVYHRAGEVLRSLQD